MDNYTSGGIGASIIVFCGIVYKLLNHKRIKSSCCGRNLVVSVDVEETTPTTQKGAPT
jgi:hypothetical protein